MGCGSSGGEFSKVEVVQVADALSREDKVGQRVQIVGRVGHAGSVLESPFTERQGVAIKIKAMIPSGGPGGGEKKILFTANCCTSFYVVDDTQAIRVNVADQSKWQLTLTKTDDVFNIYQDELQSVLFSGGKSEGLKNEAKERPNAWKFWSDFNGGKDAPTRMTAINGKGMAGFGNRPRMAQEHVLAIGDIVSVLGVLQKTDERLTMEPGTSGALTNMPSFVKALNSCSAKERSGDTAKPDVLPMTK